MKTINWSRQLVLNVSFLVVVATSGGFTQAGLAQFTSPPGQGSPGGTAGGGSRPSQPFCGQSANRPHALVAMAPTIAVGLTSNPHPTVWVNVPETAASMLEFSLFTQEQDGVYQTNLPIHTSGLLSITVPTDVALTAGKPYYWTAALVCNPQHRTEDWVVGGWIQRQPLSADLQRQLAGATAAQQLALYARSGFWYDALTAYLLHQSQFGSNRSVVWANLLTMAGLTPIAEPTLMTQAPR